MDEEIMNQEEIVQQDEPLFIVKTRIDKQFQEEASRTVMGKAPLVMNIILYSVFGLSFLWLLIDSLFNKNLDKNAILLILIPVVLIYTFLNRKSGPQKALKRWEDNIIRRFGTTALHLTTEFYPRSLAQTMEEDGTLLTEGYSALQEVKESDNLFLLRYDKQSYFFVYKYGFQKGTVDEFRTFINARIGGK